MHQFVEYKHTILLRAYSKDFFNNTHMASTGALAYNGDLGLEPPAGLQGQSPRGGSGGKAPLKPTRFLCLKW